MKILYDYPALSQTHGGVSRYICGIIEQLDPEVKIDMSILFTDNIYIKNSQFPKIGPFFIKNDFKGKIKLEKILNSLYANYKIIRNSYDIFHATYSDPYFLLKPKKPIVVTIHDMINEMVPEYKKSHAKHIESKKKLIYSSTQIITVTENTKKDLLQLYPVDPNKITVIHHGAPAPATKILKNEFGKYLLYVGRRSRYKNFRLFVEAISTLLLEDKNLKLVCVGQPFDLNEATFLEQLGISQQVQALSVSDDLLYSLYRHAVVFIFPSIYEGFGIPILEAFANNCPVCLSHSSCFPEIAGNAAIYFDPEDKISILQSVQKVITDKTLSSELIKLGSERLSMFTWKKAAQQTADVYRKTI